MIRQFFDPEFLTGFCVVLLFYVCGVGHGVWLGWTQEAKFHRYVAWCQRVQTRIGEAYDRALELEAQEKREREAA